VSTAAIYPPERLSQRADDPTLAEIGVVALVPDRVMGVWAPRHHVLSRLARYFHVVWLAPPQGWREALKFRRRDTGLPRVPPLPPGLAVYESAGWLPSRPRWLGKLTTGVRLRQARRLLESRGCVRIILYLWRPEFASALGAVPVDLTCYHIDDEYTFSDIDLPIDEAETRLLASVDQVFIHSPALFDKKGHINRRTTFLPNGVDFEAYATYASEPPDLACIPHPRIGYTGIIKKQLDWSLLDDLAQRHPDWSFVYVGPRNYSLLPPPRSFHNVCRRPNVYFLGPKEIQSLAAYPQHFDVCIMPYQANEYTKYIYPLKLHEYLASGSPVVGTRIRTLEDFVDVVKLATTPDEWSAALREALSPVAAAKDQRQKRQSVARCYDWDILVRRIAVTLAGHLGPEYAKRLDVIDKEEVVH
jgi:glycosyltransferase involved in cell wall biosynthesis